MQSESVGGEGGLGMIISIDVDCIVPTRQGNNPLLVVLFSSCGSIVFKPRPQLDAEYVPRIQ